jgi:hypothetical protein
VLVRRTGTEIPNPVLDLVEVTLVPPAEGERHRLLLGGAPLCERRSMDGEIGFISAGED